MFIYLALFAYFAAGAFMNGIQEVRARPWQLGITAIILIVLIGFRWHVGADWNTYSILLSLSRMGQFDAISLRSEPAYGLLNSIAASAGWDIWFPNLICGMIFTYGLIVFCRQQPNPWLALVVALPYLIIGVGMGYTRQSAAVGFAMLAMADLARGARTRMFVSIGVATLFHTSAIMLAPLFALASARRGLVTGALLALLAVALYYSFSERIAMRMSEYESFKYVAGGAVPRIMMNVFAATIFLFARKRFTTVPEERRLWTLISLLTFAMIPLLYYVSSTTIVDRVGIFLVPLQLFVMARAPVVFGREKVQNVGFLLAVIAYSFVAEVVWLSFGNEARSWIPYRNYLWERLFEPSA